jgi:hypothetical protein
VDVLQWSDAYDLPALKTLALAKVSEAEGGGLLDCGGRCVRCDKGPVAGMGVGCVGVGVSEWVGGVDATNPPITHNQQQMSRCFDRLGLEEQKAEAEEEEHALPPHLLEEVSCVGCGVVLGRRVTDDATAAPHNKTGAGLPRAHRGAA